MLKKRQNEVKRNIFLFDEVKKKNRSAIIAGWEDEAAINNERSHTTLLAFEKGFIEYILRGKMWLYGFESVFSRFNWIFVCLYLLFLL